MNSNRGLVAGGLLSALLALGCNALGTDTGNPADGGGFVADSPFGELVGSRVPTDGHDDDDPTTGEPLADERAILEADLIQLDGSRLYALAPSTGLHVIEIAPQGGLRRLGGHRTGGAAFEMYRDGGRLYVLVNDFYQYVEDAELGGYVYRSSARVVILDAADPAAIEELGSYSVPGQITDSRRVGDVLYVVSVEDNACWRCDTYDNTTITALDVSDPASVSIVDQLRFEGDGSHWNYWHPVMVTDQRIYVGSDGWNEASAEERSFIRIVDISDPSGMLAPGADVPVEGSIGNRWQMDEREGVLRVITQPQRDAEDLVPPVVQTFEVRSSDELAPLGRLVLRLPRPERLRSVRFDGDRAYAVTSEQTDPLFTLDLSDPAQPAQLGELELPGFIHYIEPRGDQLITLGFDQGNPAGALHVSLFDVADLTQPRLLSRVNFADDGGEFGSRAERLHKALGIHPAEGLLTIPYSSFSYDDSGFSECPGTVTHGIQLVDLDETSLTARGVAPMVGTPGRALLHAGVLLGVSTESVQSFDLADRDAPAELDELRLARHVQQLAVSGDTLIRLSTDPETRQQDVLEVLAPADAEAAESTGELELAAYLPDNPKSEPDAPVPSCEFEWADEFDGIFVHDDHVYLASFSYGDLILSVFDIRDPQAPRFVDRATLPIRRSYPDFEIPFGREHAVVQVGSTLVWSELDREWRQDELVRVTPAFSVVDLSEAGSPRLVERVERPEGLGVGGISHEGDMVLAMRMQFVGDDRSRVRFFVDRLDVSDPASPALLEPINVPGILLDLDPVRGRAVTLDLHLGDPLASDECASVPAALEREDGCFALTFGLSLLELDGAVARRLDEVELDGRVTAAAVGQDRVFVATTDGSRHHTVSDDLGTTDPGQTDVTVYAIDDDGLARGATETLVGSFYDMRVRGRRAVMARDAGLIVLDAADAGEIEVDFVASDAPYCFLAHVGEHEAICLGYGVTDRVEF